MFSIIIDRRFARNFVVAKGISVKITRIESDKSISGLPDRSKSLHDISPFLNISSHLLTDVIDIAESPKVWSNLRYIFLHPKPFKKKI